MLSNSVFFCFFLSAATAAAIPILSMKPTTNLKSYLARRAGDVIGAELARRVEAAWAAYESVRQSGGVAAGLPLLRRWQSLRQVVACRLAGQAVVVALPTDAILPLPCRLEEAVASKRPSTKTMSMKTTPDAPPFFPGDKVRLKPRPRVPHRKGALWVENSRQFSSLPRYAEVYVVRRTFFNSSTKTHGIHLAGIHGMLTSQGEGECGFVAGLFTLVHRCREVCPPVPPAVDELVQVAVTPEMADLLGYLHLPGWLAPFCRLEPDEEAGSIVRRWTKKAPGLGIGIALQVMQKRVTEEIAAGSKVDHWVPMTATDYENVQCLAAAVGVRPDEWLQGALGILAGWVKSARSIENRKKTNRGPAGQ